MKSIRFLFTLLAFGALATSAKAQLTIDQCYELAKQNYPLIVQKELIAQSKEFTVAMHTPVIFRKLRFTVRPLTNRM
jgi:hypothetical protein